MIDKLFPASGNAPTEQVHFFAGLVFNGQRLNSAVCPLGVGIDGHNANFRMRIILNFNLKIFHHIFTAIRKFDIASIFSRFDIFVLSFDQITFVAITKIPSDTDFVTITISN